MSKLLVLCGLEEETSFAEHGLKFTSLVQVQQNVAPADKFAVDVHLGDGGPVAELLDAIAKFLVFEAVVCSDLVGIHALHLKDLEHGTAKTALWHAWRALHEHHEWVLLHSILDLDACIVGEPAHHGRRDVRAHCLRDAQRGALTCSYQADKCGYVPEAMRLA